MDENHDTKGEIYLHEDEPRSARPDDGQIPMPPQFMGGGPPTSEQNITVKLPVRMGGSGVAPTIKVRIKTQGRDADVEAEIESEGPLDNDTFHAVCELLGKLV